MTVADYIATFLVEHGVRHVFGYQGSAMLKMLDAMMATGRIEYVQGFHEQASAFSADAYARVSGGVGVAIATSGPGAANLISGIANAYYDSIPVLFITGQDYLRNVVNPNHARQNGFQDMDIVSMSKPVVKYAVRLDNPEDVRKEFDKALRIATSGRKGPVLLDIPIDVQFAEIDPAKLEVDQCIDCLSNKSDESGCQQALKLIQEASRPLLLVGGGVRTSGSIARLESFMVEAGIPAVTTLNGIDACKNSIGFAGLYGTTAANLALLHADLIIALGARFSAKHTGRDKKKYAPHAKIIHVEIDSAEINRTFMCADVAIRTDLGFFLEWMGGRIGRLEIADWRSLVDYWERIYADTICKDKNGQVSPVRFVRDVCRSLPDDGVIVSDVGANQMWVAQAFRARSDRQRLINSAGHGAMGYALPAAIGASYARHNLVVAIMGDGGFQMNLQELNTLALRKPNVKCIVFNNNVLGLMRDTQTRYYQRHYYGNCPSEFTCPDLEKLANVYRLPYVCIDSNDKLGLIAEAFREDGPMVVDVRIDADCPVLNRYDDEVLCRE